MSFVAALAICLGVIGGILAYLCLGPAAGAMHIWLIFIGAAAGVALGGTPEAYKNMVICALMGMVVAWVASLIVINVPLAATLTLPVWAGLVVGITTGLFVAFGHIPFFATIPATVVGYAGTFAYLLGDPKTLLTNDVLLGAKITNPLFCITLSILVAAAFGLVSLRLATMMSTRRVATAAAE